MWRQTEDTTFRNIRESAVEAWLTELLDHPDVSVRGGVKATREYIEDLKKQILFLEEKNEMKEKYLKKLKEKL